MRAPFFASGDAARIELPIAVGCALNVNHKAMAHASTAERAFYFLGLAFARLIYHVRVTGRDALPAGGFLLLPNHITWVDAIVLQLATPRPIRFIIHDEYYRNAFLHSFLRLVGCIPINPKRAKEAIRAAADKISAGEIVCLF